MVKTIRAEYQRRYRRSGFARTAIKKSKTEMEVKKHA